MTKIFIVRRRRPNGPSTHQSLHIILVSHTGVLFQFTSAVTVIV